MAVSGWLSLSCMMIVSYLKKKIIPVFRVIMSHYFQASYEIGIFVNS